MLFLYFTVLGIGAGLISVLFLKDIRNNQQLRGRDLIKKINKISKSIDDWERGLDHFFQLKFQKPLAVSKVENPFSNPSAKQSDNTPLKKKLEKISSDDSNSKVPPPITVTPQIDEQTNLEINYKKLEILFFEKSAAIEKLEKALENEIKNRQKFDVLKNIFETQIEKDREKNRHLQLELGTLQNENEEYRSKIIQLESQILEKQKNIQDPERKGNDILSPSNKTARPDLIYLTSEK